MGRELQKKKKRSGRQPVRRKPGSKKQILNNPIIASNWNTKETLSQNYRRLGLVSKLNKRAGGVTKPTNSDAEAVQKAEQPFAILPGTTHTQKPIEEVHLEHDVETGDVKVLNGNAGGRTALYNPLDDPLNELEDEQDTTIPFNALGHTGRKGTGSGITGSLEELAAMGVSKRLRQQSEREEEWIARLVQKHGDDCSAMFRDRKLNPMQQSEGDIKRRIKKWRSKQKSKQNV